MDAQKFSELVDAVVAAEADYEAAAKAASTARGIETDALNRLNAAQRALTAAMDDAQKAAPQRSDWRRDRYIRGEAA